MPYKGLPEDALKSEQRFVGLPGKDPKETRDLLAGLNRFPVYGLLLAPDVNDPFSKMIAARWDDLHHMTGENFLLLAFQPPESFSHEFEAAWRRELGADFHKVWGKWQDAKTTARKSYDFESMFAERNVLRSEMPCLVLFTSPEAKRAAVLRIPDWSEADIWKFLEVVCDTIDECAREPDPEARLVLLQRSLTSFPARAKARLGHLAAEAEAYIRANPVKVAVMTLSFVVALATASVIPLGAGGVAFLKDIIGILKSA